MGVKLTTTTKQTAVQITPEVSDGVVSTKKLQDLAVTGEKLAASSVTADKLAPGAVGTASIVPGSITESLIHPDGLGSTAIKDHSITDSKVQLNGLNTGSIAAEAVTTAKIALAAVTAERLANNAVTGEKVANEAITALKLALDAVATDRIQNSAVTRAKIDSNLQALVDRNIGVALNAKAPAYGIVADGEHDDTPGLLLFEADLKATGLPGFFPAGHYVFKSSTPIQPNSNSTYYGLRGRTIIDVQVPNGTMFQFDDERSNVNWYDLTFTTPNTKSAASRAIYWDAKCTDMTVENCWFENFKSNGMRVNPGSSGENLGERFRIVWNKFTNIYQNRSAAPINSIFADDSTIAFNEIWNCGVGGAPDISVLAWQPNTLYLNGDTVTNGGKVYYNLGNNGTSGNSGGPTGSSTSVDGQITWTYGTDVGHALAVQHAIYLSGGCKNMALIGNHITNADGIDCGVTAGPTVFIDMLVKDNLVRKAKGSPAYIFAAVYGAIIQNNFASTEATGTQMLIYNSNDVVIDDNIYDQGGLDSVTSLQIGFAGGPCRRIRVTNNQFRNPAAASISSIGVNVIDGRDITVSGSNHFLDLANGILLNGAATTGLYVDDNYGERTTGNGNFQFCRVDSSAAGSSRVYVRENTVNGGHVVDFETGLTDALVARNIHFNSFGSNILNGTYTNVRVVDNWDDTGGYPVPAGTDVVWHNNRVKADGAVEMPSMHVGITAYAGAEDKQTNATELLATVCVVTTSLVDTNAVRLKKTSVASAHQLVFNDADHAVDCYPPSGINAAIDSLSNNAPYSIPAGGKVHFWRTSTTKWRTA